MKVDLENCSSRAEIKEKLRQCFDGKIVRKDLTKKIKEGANVYTSSIPTNRLPMRQPVGVFNVSYIRVNGHALLKPRPKKRPIITIGSHMWLKPPKSTIKTKSSGHNQKRPSPNANLVTFHASFIPAPITLIRSINIKIIISISLPPVCSQSAKQNFYSADGIINVFLSLSDLALYHDNCQKTIEKEIRESQKIPDLDVQALQIPYI